MLLQFIKSFNNSSMNDLCPNLKHCTREAHQKINKIYMKLTKIVVSNIFRFIFALELSRIQRDRL